MFLGVHLIEGLRDPVADSEAHAPPAIGSYHDADGGCRHVRLRRRVDRSLKAGPVMRRAFIPISAFCGAMLLASVGHAAVVRALPASHEEPASRTFGDWLATCDNQLDCVLDGFGADDTPATLILSRPHGGSAPAILVLQPDQPHYPASVRLQLGRHGPSVVMPMLSSTGAGPVRGALSPAATATLVSMLRTSGRLSLLGQHIGGVRPDTRIGGLGTIRLAGAATALDWIEARQHRQPEPLPLVRSPPGDMLLPADPHRVPSMVSALPMVRACGHQDADDPSRDPAAWSLTATVTLWQVPCGSGNFDSSSLFVLTDSNLHRAVQAVFWSPPQVGPGQPGQLVNAQVGRNGLEIVATEPRRGLGDCGDQRVYRWDGVRYRLTLARLMIACHGLAPEDWPVVYRSRSNPGGPGSATP
ncbi:MAG: DUF1176 domain-containing protein [Janthinobacterium lividum]